MGREVQHQQKRNKCAEIDGFAQFCTVFPQAGVLQVRCAFVKLRKLTASTDARL
jgi:hypothetical protein